MHACQNDGKEVPFAIVIDDDGDMAQEIAEALLLPDGAVMVTHGLAPALEIVGNHPSIELIVTDYYLTQSDCRPTNGEQLLDCLNCLFPDRTFEYVVISGDPHALRMFHDRPMVTCQLKPLCPDVLIAFQHGKNIPGRYADCLRKRDPDPARKVEHESIQ